MEIVNNNDNSNVNMSEMPVNYINIIAPSTSEILSTLSIRMSSCRVTIELLEAKELSKCLPLFRNMLSEMNEKVAFTQYHQQPYPEEWKDLLPNSVLSSSTSSDASSDDSSESSSVDDLFISRVTAAINNFAPNSVFNRRRAKKIRMKKI